MKILSRDITELLPGDILFGTFMDISLLANTALVLAVEKQTTFTYAGVDDLMGWCATLMWPSGKIDSREVACMHIVWVDRVQHPDGRGRMDV